MKGRKKDVRVNSDLNLSAAAARGTRFLMFIRPPYPHERMWEEKRFILLASIQRVFFKHRVAKWLVLTLFGWLLNLQPFLQQNPTSFFSQFKFRSCTFYQSSFKAQSKVWTSRKNEPFVANYILQTKQCSKYFFDRASRAVYWCTEIRNFL